MNSASSLFPVAAGGRGAELAVEKLLAEGKCNYRDMLEAAPDAMVVVNQGGEVDFSEEFGETTFHVELPCWDHLVSLAIDRDAPQDSLRILLCEDDPDAAVVLREQLRLCGYATDFAYTVADAITLAEATRYSAILTDLQLPDGDGIDLIARLRAQMEYGDTPIIVVSGNPTLGRSDSRSSTLNVFHWLSKPVDFGYLTRVLPKPRKVVG